MKKAVLVVLLCAGVFWATLNKHQMAEAWAGVEKKISSFLGSRGLDDGLDEELGEGKEKQNQKPEGEVLLSESPPPPKILSAKETASAPAPSSSSSPSSSFLPDDHFYARERLVEFTDRGLTAIPAGRLVRKLVERNGKYLVEDSESGMRLHIEPWKLTRDVTQVPGGAR